jgi:hypothetical protein
MEVVTIDSLAFDAYADVAYADEYLAASLHAGTDWSGATDTTKGQALVTMTRILDRQRWRDAYATQALREGVAAIQDACVEGALALVQGSDLQTAESTAQKLSSIRAGSVALTYFRGAEGRPHRFPTIVYELLRDYVAGASMVVQGVATGVDGTSSTEDDFGHTGSI